jgi:molecular chaperone HtpG
MRRLMKAMNKEGADAPARVNLEINPRHAVMKKLSEFADAGGNGDKAALGKLVAEQILDNALISAGLLEDPNRMVQRLYKILESV